MSKSIIFTAIVMLAVGVAAGYWFSGGAYNGSPATSGERQPLFYRNPMNPTVTSPVPAKDAMGMDYVAVYAEDDGNQKDPAGTVKVDPVVSQNIGVRTAVARRTSITREIRAVARVDYDEQGMTRLHSKVEGWIEELRIDKTGEVVDEGDVLLSIYSPKLVSTQQEYLLALKNLDALKSSPFDDIRRGAEELVLSSRERLLLFDVPEHQIRQLEQSRETQKNLHIHSPVPGTVISIGARAGHASYRTLHGCGLDHGVGVRRYIRVRIALGERRGRGRNVTGRRTRQNIRWRARLHIPVRRVQNPQHQGATFFRQPRATAQARNVC